MSTPFDPYHKWLAIRPTERPLTYYRLLGLSPLEDDVDVIADAVERQRSHIRSYLTGQYATDAEKVIEHLAQAEYCLLNAAKKAAYDAELRNLLGMPPPPPALAPTAPGSHPPMPAPTLPVATAPVYVAPTMPVMQTHPVAPAMVAQTSPIPTAPAEVVHINTNVAPEPGVSATWMIAGVVAGLLLVGGAGAYFLLPQGETPITLVTDPPHTPPVTTPTDPPPVEPDPSQRAPVDPPEPKTTETIDTTTEKKATEKKTPKVEVDPPADPPEDNLPTPTVPKKGPDEPTPVPSVPTPVPTKPVTPPDPPITPDVPADPPEKTPAVLTKLIAPDADRLTAARKRVHDDLATEFEAKTPEEKQSLAHALLKGALETKDDALLAYAYLDEANTAATSAGDAELAWQAIHGLDQLFEIKPIPLKSAALREAARHDLTPPERIAEMYQALVEQAVERDEFDAAGVLISAGVAVARKADITDLVTALQNRSKELRDWRAELVKSKAARDKLANGSEDKDANLTVGKYACLVQKDGLQGAPFLAKSGHAAYEKLAALELADLTKVDARVALGDAWWAEYEQDSTIYKPALQRRALYWYERSLNDAPPAVFNRLQQRIESLPKGARVGRFGVLEIPPATVQALLGRKTSTKPPQTASVQPPTTVIPKTPTPVVPSPADPTKTDPTTTDPAEARPVPSPFGLTSEAISRLPPGPEKARAFVASQLDKLDAMHTRQLDLYRQWTAKRADYVKLEEKIIPIQKDAQVVDTQARSLQTQLARVQGYYATQQSRLANASNEADRANARSQMQTYDTQIRQLNFQLSTLQTRYRTLMGEIQEIQRQGVGLQQEAARLASDSDLVTRDWLVYCDPLARYGQEFRDQAIQRYTEWIKQESQLSLPYIARAFAYAHRGDDKVAESDLEQALAVDLRMKPLVEGINAWLLARKRGLSRNIPALTQAIKTAPKLHVLYLLRGQLQFDDGDFTKALDDFTKVAREAPNTSEAFEWQGLIYATSGRETVRNGEKAVEAAAQACELTRWADWRCVDTLALAYAEKGDFAAAIQHGENSLKLAPTDKQELVRQHLEKFKANTAVRTENAAE